MYMKKQRGIIMLEVLILLSMLMVLILCNSKLIVSNSSKLSLYEIKEDILTIDDDEYELLKRFKEKLNEDKELYEKIENLKEDLKFLFEYRENKNDNLCISVKNGQMFIKRKIDSVYYSYKEIMCNFSSGEIKEVTIVPKRFKISNLEE